MNTHIYGEVSLKILKWIEFLIKSHYVEKNVELKALTSEENRDFTIVMKYIKTSADTAKNQKRFFLIKVAADKPKVVAGRE